MLRYDAVPCRRIAAIAAVAMAPCLVGAADAAPLPPSAHETAITTVDGTIVTPASSAVLPGDAGRRAHTNTRLFFPAGTSRVHEKPYGRYETPASLACVYGLVAPTAGCNPATATALPNGGSKVIVIVDAYDAPTAAADLQKFSKYFGLPKITSDNFQVVYAGGVQPDQDDSGGWELEEALDVQMAHAMAPLAKIILVEAATSSLADLYKAETLAGQLAASAGGGDVSNSWGTPEYAGEASDESYFGAANTVYFASTGDRSGTEAPSVFSDVIAVGGTEIERKKGIYTGQIGWADTGGGSSAIPVPAYQSSTAGVAARVRQYRGVPDISFDASPMSGGWIYDSFPYQGGFYGWLVIGGTSLSAPAMAGVVNAAGYGAFSSADELAAIYANYRRKTDWTDIATGICGSNDGANVLRGYDFCTGVGVPHGYLGK